MTLQSNNPIVLEDLCALVVEQVKPENAEDSVYIGLEHISPGKIFSNSSGYAEDVQSHKYVFRKNDVLYGKLRPYLDKAVLAKTDGICTTELLVLRPNEGVFPLFLACMLHNKDFIDYAMEGVTGVQHPRTSWAHIKNYEIGKFSQEVSRKIGILLSTVQKASLYNENLFKLAGELKHATMHKLFTYGLRGEPQKETDIGLVPESWDVKRLDDCARVISTRMTYAELESLEDSAGGVRVLGIKVSDMNSIGNESVISHANTERMMPLEMAKQRCAPPKTIVFPKRGAAIATNKKRITSSWSVFDPNVIGVIANSNLSAMYLFYWFQMFNLQTITEPGPTPQLNKKHLDPLRVQLPQIEKEQQELVDILDAIDQKIDLHRRKKAVLGELFKSLLHKLMTGEIRVDDLNLSALENMQLEAQGGAA
ncbi:MAG: restriction endonuclease subunit S [Desulfovibrio sp.]|jgi:type I restriction enzyme S subunit|nr:restriction endonuclease subunit S [Desulfovibrio sp.]